MTDAPIATHAGIVAEPPVEPTPLPSSEFPRTAPELAQEASYLAASARIFALLSEFHEEVQPFHEAYHGRGPFASESRPPIATRFVPLPRSLAGYSKARFRTDALALRCVQLGSAFRTEGLSSPIAAFSDFHIVFGSSRDAYVFRWDR